MATELQGALVAFKVRDYGSTSAFKTIVCEETVTFDVSNDVSTTKTKCGVFKGVLAPDFKANGSAVANFVPTSSEYSYNALIEDQKALTKKEFVFESLSDGTNNEGHLLRMSGAGYFVNSQMTGNNGETVKFTWSFEGTGTLGSTESA